MSRRQLLRLAGVAAVAAPLATSFPARARPASAPAVAAADAQCGTVVFRDQFADGTSANWSTPKFIEGNGSIDFVPDPADATAPTVARFTVPDDQVSFRAEMGEHQFEFGRYRWEISHYVPSDWTPFKYGTIITQWHGYPFADGHSDHPPLSLLVYGPKPRWLFQVFQLSGPNTVVPVNYYLDAPVVYGRWNSWVFDITWSTPTTPGLVVLSLDGAEVVRHEGDNNYHQRWAPHFQMGIYRSEWRPGKTYPRGLPPIVVYHKNFVVTDLRGCSTEEPVGVDDHATSADGAVVTLDPLANDKAAGAGSPVEPASLRLLDAAGIPVSERTVAGEGVWTLGTPAGRVVFTPDAAFIGDTTPVGYQAGYLDASVRRRTFGANMVVTVERPPLVLAPQSVTVSGGGAATLRPLDAATSSGTTRPDPDSLRILDPSTKQPVTAFTAAGVGTFTVEPDGTVRFVPVPGYEGVYDLAFVVADQFGRSQQGSVTIRVVDNAPTTSSSTPTTPESTPTTPESTPTTPTTTPTTPTTTPTTPTTTPTTPTTPTTTPTTPGTTPTTPGTTPTTSGAPTSGSASPTRTSTSSADPTDASTVSVSPVAPAGRPGAGSLAATGSDTRAATVFGAGALALGSALLALSTRDPDGGEEDAPPPDQP